MADGSWSVPFSWPIIGIHAALTPDGKVLTFGTDQNGQQGGMYFDVWDPATNSHYTLAHHLHTDLFCSSAIIVPETGEILISGGDARPDGRPNEGVPDVNVFDYRTMTLTESPTGDMEYARWYPTTMTLANGKVMIIGGIAQHYDTKWYGISTPERYTPGEGWKTIDGAASEAVANDWFYPRSFLSSNGHVITITSRDGANQVQSMDPSGNGAVEILGNLPFVEDDAHPSIMFATDKVLTLLPDGSAWVMDISGDKPTFEETSSLGATRYWANMTLLADGTVMVSGGSAIRNTLAGVDNQVAIWHPDTGEWTFHEDAAIARLYHSTALLLPDATVLSLGGGAPGPLNNLNGEIYTPPYLYDENGNLAERPAILDAPTELAQRQDFTIEVDDPASITRLTLVKFGSTTHAFNPESRMIELSYTVGPDGKLQVDLPDNANVVTPGYWMLFAFDDHGVPSVASTIHIGTGGEAYSDAVGTFLTLNGSASQNTNHNEFTLTTNSTNETGGVMANERLDMAYDFTLKFQINFGSSNAGGEGVVFVLDNDPEGGDAVGTGLGADGIRNGIGIEFDTYNDGVAAGDIKKDHTQFFDTDATPGEQALTGPTALANIENGKWHSVVVSWDAETQTLQYSIDGKSMGALTGDLANEYLGGSEYAYFGLTGATSSVRNAQQVRFNSVNAVFEDPSHHDCDCPEFDVDHVRDHVTQTGNTRFIGATSTFVLTPGTAGAQGSITSNARLDLAHDFAISFEIYLGDDDAGADGMAFVLHNDPAGANAQGMAGGGLGAYGIHNGLAIEFDVYDNGAIIGDIAQDHTGIFDTDAIPGTGQITGPTALANIEDGKWHAVQVVWDAETHTLSYTLDGVAMGAVSQDIANAYLGGSEFAHFGITAASGGIGSLQQVKITAVDAVFEEDADHGGGHGSHLAAQDLQA